jgi:hypothetical protein
MTTKAQLFKVQRNTIQVDCFLQTSKQSTYHRTKNFFSVCGIEIVETKVNKWIGFWNCSDSGVFVMFLLDFRIVPAFYFRNASCALSYTYLIFFLFWILLPWAGFELTTLVVIGTECTGNCKSKYHTIRTTTPPNLPYNQDYDNSLNYHTIRTTTTP